MISSPTDRRWLVLVGIAVLALEAAPLVAHTAIGRPYAAAETERAASSLTVGGADIRVELDGAHFTAGSDVILEWIRRSAQIVAAYYGEFPTHTLRIQVEAPAGDRVTGGTTWGFGGGLIRIRVGTDVTDDVLRRDWVLVHEMVHLALPDVGEEHAWLSEGLATYVEGVARVHAGNRSEAEVWAENVRMMPRGMPEDGDRGLDNTHTWGRTYWGGAIYCLLADVEIRKRTDGRKGLQDALRAIADASGGLSVDWPIDRVLKTGDAAVGTSALEDLYEQMKDAPMQPDLSVLWKDLGLELDGATVRLHDDAPLSDVRRAIMRPSGQGASTD